MTEAPDPAPPGERAPPTTVIFDGRRRLTFASPTFLRTLGMPEGTDLVGRSEAELIRIVAFRGLLGRGDPETLARQVLAVDRSRVHHRIIRTAEGRWLELTSEPLPDGGFIAYSHDITQHQEGRAALAEEMRRLEMVVRQQPSGVGVFDAEQRLVLHNDAYERVLGMIPGTLRRDMRLDEVQARVLSQYGQDPLMVEANAERRRIDRGKPHDEVRTLPDGRTIRTTSLPLPQGGFLVTVEDVTALRQAEEEAQHRAATLRGVLASLPYGVCVYDSSQRLTMVNDAYQHILQGAELRVGESLMDICRRREAAGEYPPGVTAQEVYERQFRRDIAPRRRRRPNGTMIEVRNAPLPDGGHINVIADVTALHEVQAEAQHRADLLRAMMDHMRHGVCLFDKDYRVVALNELARQMNDLPADVFRPGAMLEDPREIQRARGEYDLAVCQRAYIACLAVTDKPYSYIHQRPDGTILQISTDPVPGGGFVRTYADVTEDRRIRRALEKARREAEEASAVKTRFLSTMSHELRTPLNAVIGFSEAILAEEGIPPAGMEFAAAILEAGRHLLMQIDDILQVAQLGNGEDAPPTRALYLPSVLEAALRLARPQAEERRITLSLQHLPPDLPRAMAEERRLRQILLNLLSNAVKFSPEGGRVLVSALLREDGAVEIQVRDFGIGVAPGDRERAFEPFQQLEATHDRHFGGSGLGLYLARAFADAMGATLILDSAEDAAPGGDTQGAVPEAARGTVARLRLAPAVLTS